MSKLQAIREQIEKDGIGVYLPVVKQLFSAIDEHLNQDVTQSDESLRTKATELQTKVTALEAELALLKQSAIAEVAAA